MFEILKNIVKKVKNFDNFINLYKSEGKDIVIPSVAFTNWANRLMQEGKEEEAQKMLQISSNMSYKNPNTHISLGIESARKREYEKAIDHFERAIRIDSNTPRAFAFLGSIYSEMGDYKQAEKMFQIALKLDPRNAQTYANYAITLAKRGDKIKADKNFKIAHAMNPTEPNILFLWGILLTEVGAWEKAIEKFTIVYEALPFHSESLYYLAFCYFKLEEYQASVNYAKKLIGLISDNVDYYILLAEGLMNLGQEDECYQVFENAQKNILNIESNYHFYYSWGLALQKFSKYDESKIKFDKAISINDKDYLAYHGLANSYLLMRKSEDAFYTLLKVIENNPTHSNSLFNLGQLCFERKDYNEAIKYFKRSVEEDKSKIQAYFHIALSYEYLNDTNEAISYYNKLLEFDKKSVEAYMNLSRLYSTIGEDKIAIRKARNAYMIEKQNPKVIIMYAVLLLRNGQNFDAMEKFEEALKIDKTSTVAILGKCECLTKLDRPLEAVEILKSCEEKYGNQKDFLMVKLITYLKLAQKDKNEYYNDMIFKTYEKYKELFGINDTIEALIHKTSGE